MTVKLRRRITKQFPGLIFLMSNRSPRDAMIWATLGARSASKVERITSTHRFTRSILKTPHRHRRAEILERQPKAGFGASRVVLPVPVSPKNAMFLAASRRLRVTFEPRCTRRYVRAPRASRWPHQSRARNRPARRSGPTGGVASTSLRSGNVGSGLPSSTRTSGRKPSPPTMAGYEPMRERINERRGRYRAKDEHPGGGCLREGVTVEDAAA